MRCPHHVKWRKVAKAHFKGFIPLPLEHRTPSPLGGDSRRWIYRPILKSLCANRFEFWGLRIQLAPLGKWWKTAKSPPFCVVRSVVEPAPLLPHALDGELLTRSIHAKTFEKRSSERKSSKLNGWRGLPRREFAFRLFERLEPLETGIQINGTCIFKVNHSSTLRCNRPA